MKISYTLTLADINAAFRLHRRQKLIRRVNIYIWPILMVICLIGSFVFNVQTESFSLCIGIGTGSLWMTICMPIARYYNTRKCFKQLFPSKRTDRTTYIEFNEDGLHTGIPGVSEIRYLWNGIAAFAQDETTTLLYLDKSRFLFFPTRALLPDQRNVLNDLVARHVVKRKP